MQVRLITAAAVASSLFAVCTVRDARAYDYTAPVQFHTVASFDPSNGVVPFPTNLLLSGTTDLTINIPVVRSDRTTATRRSRSMRSTASAPFRRCRPRFSAPIKAEFARRRQQRARVPGDPDRTRRWRHWHRRELQPNVEYVVALPSSDTSGRTARDRADQAAQAADLVHGRADQRHHRQPRQRCDPRPDLFPGQAHQPAVRRRPVDRSAAAGRHGLRARAAAPADQFAGSRRQPGRHRRRARSCCPGS